MKEEYVWSKLSTDPSCGNTQQEQVSLARLAEEAGELVQVAIKALRFGMDNYHPDTKEMNYAAIERELADVRQAYADLNRAYSLRKRHASGPDGGRKDVAKAADRPRKPTPEDITRVEMPEVQA